MKSNENKLGLGALIAISMGSMLGAGLFALPQTVAASAGVVALLLAWLITFGGMFSIAMIFQNLSLRAPTLDTGIYSYARAALGDYLGFSSAWGYWLSILAGNIGYLIMIGAALAVLFPSFGDGTSFTALILSSLIVWITTGLCLGGIKTATMVNSIVTLLKIVPIAIFIIIIVLAFRRDMFIGNILQPSNLGPLSQQVRNTMLATVWVFVGIEGASVFSSRARRRRDIGIATICSFITMFAILFAISVLPFGILPHGTLATLSNPSCGALLHHILGVHGNILMNGALVITVLGSFLSWILVSAEVPFSAAKRDNLFPEVFALENAQGTPVGALIIGAICQQIYLVAVYVFHIGYLKSILIAASMIIPPYLFSTIYAMILVVTGRTYDGGFSASRVCDGVFSVVALIYGFWLFYAAGKYLLWSTILYVMGTMVFVVHRLIWGRRVFSNCLELGCCVALALCAIISGCTLYFHSG